MKRRDLGMTFVLLSLPAWPALAQDIFKCEVDGRVTYSNVPTKSCRKIILDPVTGRPTQVILFDGGMGNLPLQNLLAEVILKLVLWAFLCIS